jgi:hypothetical protein
MHAALARAETPNWPTCVHESSHAVAARHLGANLIYTSVVALKPVAGRTVFLYDADQTVLEKLLINIAGAMGECLLAHQGFTITGSDARNVKELLARHDDTFGYFAPLERNGTFKKAKEVTRVFVEENKLAILLVAIMLAEFGLLGGRAVDEALGITPY